MYRIIGADGNQYGPVSAEKIREWIETKRAVATTRAQAEGSEEWKPLASFEEFADAFAAANPPPVLTAPPPLPVEPAPAVVEIAKEDFSLDIGSCLGRAWDMMMTDMWPIMGISALVWFAIVAGEAAYVGLLLTGPLLGGLQYYYLRRIRGQPTGIRDAFAGFTLAFVPLMLASLVSGLLIGVGLVLCLIPGIYLLVAWTFCFRVVIDKKMKFWAAMELSRKMVYKHWWTVACLMLVCALINLGGALLCCLGYFFTLPLTSLAMTYAYKDIFNSPAEEPRALEQ